MFRVKPWAIRRFGVCFEDAFSKTSCTSQSVVFSWYVKEDDTAYHLKRKRT